MKRTYNGVTLLQSVHGHLKELGSVFDIDIICLEVHPEGVYLQVQMDDLDKFPLSWDRGSTVSVDYVRIEIGNIEYEFYAFNKRS